MFFGMEYKTLAEYEKADLHDPFYKHVSISGKQRSG
jgi:hypothetical protein